MDVKTKEITFDDAASRHLQLAAQVKYDKLTIPEFLRLMVKGYVDNHPDIRRYLEETKEADHRWAKTQLKKSKKEAKKNEEVWHDFNLTEEERTELFDIIEKEVGI